MKTSSSLIVIILPSPTETQLVKNKIYITLIKICIKSFLVKLYRCRCTMKEIYVAFYIRRNDKTLYEQFNVLSAKMVPAFTTNAITLDFLSSISPDWVVMFLDSHRMVFTFFSLLDLLGVALVFRISILKIFQLLLNYWHRVTYIISFEKDLQSSSCHTLSFYLNLVKYRFKNMLRKE